MTGGEIATLLVLSFIISAVVAAVLGVIATWLIANVFD